MKTMTAPVLDVGWHDDGTKAFIAGADKTAKVWDLAADQVMQVAAHDATVKTCHWVKAPNYTCLMTGEEHINTMRFCVNLFSLRKLG